MFDQMGCQIGYFFKWETARKIIDHSVIKKQVICLTLVTTQNQHGMEPVTACLSSMQFW